MLNPFGNFLERRRSKPIDSLPTQSSFFNKASILQDFQMLGQRRNRNIEAPTHLEYRHFPRREKVQYAAADRMGNAGKDIEVDSLSLHLTIYTLVPTKMSITF